MSKNGGILFYSRIAKRLQQVCANTQRERKQSNGESHKLISGRRLFNFLQQFNHEHKFNCSCIRLILWNGRNGIVKALSRATQYEKVTLVGRKLLDLPTTEEGSNYQKFEQKLMDFDKISEHADSFKGHDVAFYGLGVSTTSVTEAEYRRIELDNALGLAKHLKDGGCKQLHWVTGQGTKKNSWFLFAKVKGQVEEDISGMGFQRVCFYRPAAVLTSDPSGGGKMRSFLKAVDFANVMTVESEVLGTVMVAKSLQESDTWKYWKIRQ